MIEVASEDTEIVSQALRSDEEDGPEIAQALLSVGGDPSIKNFTEGKTAIEKAVSHRVAKLLKDSASSIQQTQVGHNQC